MNKNVINCNEYRVNFVVVVVIKPQCLGPICLFLIKMLYGYIICRFMGHLGILMDQLSLK